MSIPVSTVPTVKAWWQTQLSTALTASSGKTLSLNYGDSGPTEADDEVTIVTGPRTVAPHVLAGGLGAHAFEESYSLRFDVSVFRPEGFQVAEERAWSIVATIETIARSDMWAVIGAGNAATVFGGELYSIGFGEHEPTAEWSDDGAVVTIPYAVAFRAVI